VDSQRVFKENRSRGREQRLCYAIASKGGALVLSKMVS